MKIPPPLHEHLSDINFINKTHSSVQTPVYPPYLMWPQGPMHAHPQGLLERVHSEREEA